jgi:hypothetical protein
MEQNKNFGGIYTIIAFVMGSVLIPLTTLISENRFKDKKANIDEMEFNSKYVENIVANVGNLDQKIELAKYYSTVSTNKETRLSWIRYLRLLEYDKEKIRKEIIQLSDSLDKNKLDSSKITEIKEKMSSLKKLEKSNSEKNINPYSKKLENESSSSTLKRVYIQYYKENKINKNSITKLLDLGWVVPKAEKMEKPINRNEIRYFNDNDQVLAKELKYIIESESEKYDINKIDMKSPEGQLEIWIKD